MQEFYKPLTPEELSSLNDQALRHFNKVYLGSETGNEIETPEILWQKQIDRLVNLGYHEELNLTEEEYRAQMPAFQTAPDEISTEFPFPLLVDPRVSHTRQTLLLGVENDYDEVSDPKGLLVTLDDITLRPGIFVPSSPYQICAQPGRNYREHTLAELEEKLSRKTSGERGLTYCEGLALLREHPEIFFDGRNWPYQSLIWCAGSDALYEHVPSIGHHFIHNRFPPGEFEARRFSGIYWSTAVSWPTGVIL